MGQKGDRGRSTREQIVGTATELFAADGYEGTSIERVLQSCGVSRGALYHHFDGKEALFAAVLETVEAEIARKIGAAAAVAANPLDALRRGSAAWIKLASDPTVRQVVLIDAPSAVGWQAWRELEGRYSLGLLKGALNKAAEAGRIPGASVDLYAHVLLAVLTEVALVIARSDGSAKTVKAGLGAVEQLLSSLFGLKPNDPW